MDSITDLAPQATAFLLGPDLSAPPFGPEELRRSGESADALPLTPPARQGELTTSELMAQARISIARADQVLADLAVNAAKSARRDRRRAWAMREVRRGRKRADALGRAHRPPVDVEELNRQNSIAASAELAARVEAEGLDTSRFESLLDQAERQGWEGEDLTLPAGLTDDQAAAFAETWRSGREQRIRDEAELREWEGVGRC